MVNLGEGLHT
uniref:Uncharacterized protein n=1 Tax=Rhizophora mucronata TaxID=61149 RepID=A0A2P2J9W2_RHIMU